jgi:choline kinase
VNYIILAAGKGTRLHPLTLSCPKCLFNLSEDYSILQRMIDKIKKYDSKARIVTVVGFMSELIKDKITGIEFVYNPFFEVTNSVASLWFTKEYLCDEVTIINGDIVMDSQLVQEVLVKSFEYPLVLLDSSIKSNGDYNVQVQDDNVLVMSKELNQYYGEYAGVSKIGKNTIQLFKAEIEKMVSDGYYDQWYENVLVQLIFNSNLKLKYKDISKYEWTEVDCVDDLLKAKSIQVKENLRI